MTILVTKKLTKKELKKAITEMLANKQKLGLKNFFGTAVEKIDAVEFQRKVRDEWN
jgi:hypothetical protein